MSSKPKETKGPIGDESPPVPAVPDLTQVLAAQGKLAAVLGKIGPVALTAAANVEQLARRVEVLERANLLLVEVVRQLHGALQETGALRR